MLKKYPQFTFGFAIIFLAELIATANDLREIRFVTKPLITIILMLFLHFAIEKKGRFTKKIITGLLFSLFGDVLLMFAPIEQTYFMLGLGSFLIAHLFYISAFYLDSNNKTQINQTHVLPISWYLGFSVFPFITSYIPTWET